MLLTVKDLQKILNIGRDKAYSLMHSKSFPSFSCPRFFHIYMIVAILTVVMTYLGVNHLLGGMHSYG